MDKNKIFIEKAFKVHGYYYDYSYTDYINAKTKIKIRCKKHNHIFEQTPTNHLSGSGCPICGKERIQKAKTDNKEIFVKKSVKKHGKEYDYSKVVYKGNREKVEIICKKHGSFWQTPNNHIGGRGCPKCRVSKIANKKRRFTTEEYIKECKQIHDNFYTYPNTIFKSANKIIEVECPIHGTFYPTAGAHFYKKTGCPKCGRKKAAESNILTNEEFIEKAILRHNAYYTYPYANYKGIREKVIITCPKHGNFEQVPMNHLAGAGCSKCHSTKSKLEKELISFISKFENVEENNRKILEGYEIDIYSHSKKVGIEFDGLYYHSDKFVDKYYHKKKTDIAKDKKIQLIHIFEDEWLYKKDIVKSRLLSVLGKTPNKIYARKCEIKEVLTKEAMEFLDKNHLQGRLGASTKLGLYYEKELVSIMTFGKLRKNLGASHKDGSFELLRFCNKINTTVVGGASKLFKHFINNYEFNEIISYCDLRWSKGDLYEKLGFSFVIKTEPNYFYTKGSKRENRFKYRKSELVKKGYDKNKTEREIMNDIGFNRVYDCGSLKYIYTIKKSFTNK